MSDLKIGDIVQRTTCVNPNHKRIRPGMVGTVTAIETTQARVTWKGHEEDESMSLEWCDKGRLELLYSPADVVAAPGLTLEVNTKPSNPKDRAATHRLDLSLFPETATVFGAIAMTEGDCKYGGYNYRVAGVKVSTYVAAERRHIGKYFDRGEWADPKTGVPHLANALACIAVLIDGHCKGNITDDRPPKMEADLYTWAEQTVKKLHEIFPDGIARFTETKDGNTDGSIPDWLTQKS